MAKDFSGWARAGYIDQDGYWYAQRIREVTELTLEQFERLVDKKKFRLWKLKK